MFHYALAAALLLAAQMPGGMTHEQHRKAMADHAMGFDQDKAAHHFHLYDDGGAIEVTAKSDSDAATIAAIRAHLRSTADAFTRGDFGSPIATHGEAPDGTAALRERKAAVTYAYVELPAGGRIDIVTSDPAALDAAHAFLRYQIREHKTGDSPSVVRRPLARP
jgi:hypothetical protein